MINFRYTIQRLLGEGGSGAVFLCEDTLHSGIRRAVKILHDDPADGQLVEEVFRTEVSTLSILTHPHLVSLHDFGVVRVCDEKPGLVGRRFFVMDYLQGVDSLAWASALPEGPFRGKLIEELLRQALTVLTYIHQEGIIHYDIKPENLLTTGEPLSPVLKLMDFGFSGGHQGVDASQARGTLHYTAPEILRGNTPDFRVDLYSLGATFYHLVEGQPPFPATNPVDLVKRALSESPTFTHVSWGHAPLLKQAVEILMAKDPARRRTSHDLIHTVFSQTPSSQGRQFSSPVPSRIVGREQEQAVVLKAITGLQAKSDTAPPTAVCISGPEGMGKTRLLHDAILKARIADLPVFIIESTAARMPFESLASALRELWAEAQTRGALERTSLPQLWKPVGGLLAGAAKTLGTRLDDRDRQNQVFIEQIARFAIECGSLFPFVIAADNVNFLDEQSREVLRTIARDATPGTLIVITTQRSFDVSHSSTPGEIRLDLRELDLPSFTALMDTYLGHIRTLDLVCTRVYEQFGGTPGLVVQAIHLLRDRLTEQARNDSEAAAEFLQSPGLFPADGARGLLMNRFLQTPRERQLVLLLLSCFENPPRLDILQRVLPFHPERWRTHSELLDLEGLASLSDHREKISLRHESMRTVLYDMLAEDRISLHQTIALAMEQELDPSLGIDLLELGHQWAGAGNPSSAVAYYERASLELDRASALPQAIRAMKLGIASAENAENPALALRLSLRLARLYQRSRAYADARATSLPLLDQPLSPSEHGQVHTIIGMAESHLGNLEEALVHLSEAVELADDPYERLQTRQELANLDIQQGRFKEAESAAQLHLAEAKQLNNLTLQAIILNDLGIVTFFQDRFIDAQDYFRKAMDCYRELGDDLRVADELVNVGNALSALGENGRAIECWTEASELITRGGTLHQQSLVQNNLGIAYFNTKNYPKARDCYLAARDISRRLDMQNGLAYALSNLGELALLEGRYQEALQSCENARQLFLAMGSARDLAESAILLARTWLIFGEHKRARDLIREAGEQIAANEIHSLSGQLDLLQGQLAFDEGAYATGSEHARLASSRFEGSHEATNSARCILLHGECLYRSGDTRGAVEQFRRVLQEADMHRQRRFEAEACYFLGLCERQTPQITGENAIVHFKKSLEILTREPVSELTWQVLFELARELFERGQRDRAREYLAKAKAVLHHFASGLVEGDLRTRYMSSKGRAEILLTIQRHLTKQPA